MNDRKKIRRLLHETLHTDLTEDDLLEIDDEIDKMYEESKSEKYVHNKRKREEKSNE